MASKAEIARNKVRIIITKETAKGPRAVYSIPANMEDAQAVADARAAVLTAAGHKVTVATVTMALV